MLVAANTFIEDCKPIIEKQTGNDVYKNEKLLTYLKRAYIQLQKDYPLFQTNKELTAVNDGFEYDLEDEVLDIVSLVSNKEVYSKIRVDKFFEKYSSQSCNKNIFTLDMDVLYIYPETKAEDKIEIFYKYVKPLGAIDEEFKLPLLLTEALRYCFLSKFFEEQPKREGDSYVALDLHYYKLYEKEVAYAQRQLKIRHKNITSNFQRI